MDKFTLKVVLVLAIVGGIWGTTIHRRAAANSVVPAVTAPAPQQLTPEELAAVQWDPQPSKQERLDAIIVDPASIDAANAQAQAKREAKVQAEATAQAVVDEQDRRKLYRPTR